MKLRYLLAATALAAVFFLALNLVNDAPPMPPAAEVIPPIDIPAFACPINGSCKGGPLPWK